MVVHNRVALLTLACMALIISAQAMDSSVPDAPAIDTSGMSSPTPDASGMASTPDLSGMAATPTPDTSGMASTPSFAEAPDFAKATTGMTAGGPTPAATPDASSTTASATPTTPEIQPEQMKGDDVLELSEEKPGELLPSGNPGVSALTDQAKSVTDDLVKMIEQITQQHMQLQGQLGQLQGELDTFYQTSGAQRGKIGEILNEITLPLTAQPVTPTMIPPHTRMPVAPATPANVPGMTFGTTLPPL